MKIKLVLCWLGTVAAMLMAAGCATNRNETVKASGTPSYAVRKIVLPKQKPGPAPFSVSVETSYSPRSERELVLAMEACEYLEALAASGRFPLRVREGLIVKHGNEWQHSELPFEKSRRHGCLPPFVHFALKSVK